MCFQGIVPAGDGFKLDTGELRALGYTPDHLPPVIRRYIIGKDLVQRPQERFIVDFFASTKPKRVTDTPICTSGYSIAYTLNDERNKRAAYRTRWWVFAEPRPAMRRALAGLRRYIVTPYTAKYRPFIFVGGDTLPDAMAYAIASDDAFMLGVLSSRIHGHWARETGGTLEDRPRYNSNATFFPFPFPHATEAQQARIREVAESLDASAGSVSNRSTDTDPYGRLQRPRKASRRHDSEPP